MLFSAHQPAYLPWLGYFHKLALSDKFVILDNVQFEKNSYTNRNQIKTSNGPIWLTVPVLNTGHSDKTIREMKINNNENWRDKHWKGIYFNYKKAPYFDKYASYFEDFYTKDWVNLIDVTNEQIKFFMQELNINTEVIFQSTLAVHSKKQQLIVDLCHNCGANNFIFGAQGKEYADEEFFKKNNLEIYFQNYKHPIYVQQYGGFVQNMSIIDLLFNIPKNCILDIILSDNISKSELEKIFKEKK
ncbi:MAG: WbqC family protein [Patescibacteria group bacterium]|jgi:hypothetical protein